MTEFADGPVVQIDLCFDLEDFDESPEDSGTQAVSNEEPGCSATVEVNRLASNLFKVAGPVSLTPFGPFGPMLSCGTIIEAEPRPDGTHRYIRSREIPEVWSRVLSDVPLESIRASEATTLLDRLSAGGGAWEWCAGNLTIQGRPPEAQPEPTPEMERLIAELAGLVVSREE